MANLSPREYRVHLKAANGDGGWSDSGEVFVFSVEPAFWQGRPFAVLCGVLLTALAALAYTWRIRAISAQVRMYYRFQTDVMVLTVAILVVLVQLLQWGGNALARRLDKR